MSAAGKGPNRSVHAPSSSWRKVCGTPSSSSCRPVPLGSLISGGTVEGGVQSVAAVVDRPDRQSVRDRASLRGKRCVLLSHSRRLVPAPRRHRHTLAKRSWERDLTRRAPAIARGLFAFHHCFGGGELHGSLENRSVRTRRRRQPELVIQDRVDNDCVAPATTACRGRREVVFDQ